VHTGSATWKRSAD